MTNDPIVITGRGIVTATGSTPDDVWSSLITRKTAISEITGFDASGFGCPFAAEVKGLNAEAMSIHPRDARIMDIHAFMLMQCSRNAFRQARLENSSIPKDDIGFFAGMGMIDYKAKDLIPAVVESTKENCEIDYDAFYAKGYQNIYPLWPLSMLNNISFCQAAISLDIHGENAVFSPHADSGAQAIIEGFQTVLNGKAQIVLAGGVSEKISPFSMARALINGTLNPSCAQDEQPCAPFGANRNGTVLGEGCGIVVIERHSSALKRGLVPLAAITGYGYGFEVEDNSSDPTSNAIALAMQKAIKRSGLTPQDIDVIIAHGDATVRGDANEINAINEVFKKNIDAINVYSSKGALGNLLAGAPAVDIIIAISIIKTGIIPPNLTDAPDKSAKFRFSAESLKSNPKNILINSRSSEGQCVSFIIEPVS
jgi:3-oxoacyl-[acyl-carrier-protein] synthase II